LKTEADTRINLPDQVSVRIEKGFQTKVRAGKHSLLVDEPEELGGGDTGIKPQDLLLSALGSCTAITLRMYANHKAWPLEKVDVKLQYEGEPEKEGFIPNQIKMQLLVGGNLTPEQLQRLEVIAKKCPVHSSLVPAFKISLELALAAPEF
jgi:putative redox protein